MLERSPPQSEIHAFAGQDVQFQITFGSKRSFHVRLQIDGSTLTNAPLGGDAFTYTQEFSPGRYHVRITLSEYTLPNTSYGSIDLDGQSRKFEWDITVIDPKSLYETDFERAKQVLQDVLLLYTMAEIGNKITDEIQDYYDSLTEEEKEELNEQTEIGDFLSED